MAPLTIGIHHFARQVTEPQPSTSGPSAVDIITYVGVPLTAMGVLPILWNAGRSFWIWSQIRAMVPAEARKYVSLTVDPVSGTLSIILTNQMLTWQDVFQSIESKTLEPARVREINDKLHGASWMGLVTAKVPIKTTRGTQRLIIDASLKFESRGIECNWKSFVFLALGLGVDLYHGGLQELLATTMDVHTLTDAHGKTVMQLSKLDDLSWTAQLGSKLLFSPRQAMAAGCVMILPKSNHLVPLGQYCALDDQLQSTGTYSFPSADSICQALKNIEKLKDRLSIALTWTLYLELIYYEEKGHELLLVPQFVLQAREESVKELNALHGLADKLHEIFQSKSLEDKIASALAANEAFPTYGVDTRKGREALNSRKCPTYVGDVYPHLRKGNPFYRQLLERFYPSEAEKRGSKIDLRASPLSPTAILARVILSVSILQIWPREEWRTLQGGEYDVTYIPCPPDSPLEGLLHAKEPTVYIG